MAQADVGISPYILSVLRYDVGGDAHIAPLIYMFFYKLRDVLRNVLYSVE